VIRFAVFIATTDGPVQIQRISRERAPLSMVIRGSGSERLPVSDRYDDFARPGSGPVERFFGPFPEGGFRLEVSGSINSGDSWQLGVFLAHAVEAGDGLVLVRGDPTLEDSVNHIFWMTGQVDYDGQVSSVGHVQEKFYASRNALAAWLASGIPVTLVVPTGEDHRRLLACELPTDAGIVAATDAIVLCQELGINPDVASTAARRLSSAVPPQAQRSSGHFLVTLGALLVAASLAVLLATGQLGDVTAWPERLTALLTNQTNHMPKKNPPPKVMPQLRAGTVPELTYQPPVAAPAVSISVHERRAPVGASCADVHIGDVAAVEKPVGTDTAGQPKPSPAAELCGLLLIIDPGPKPHYLRAKVTMLQGDLIDADRPPEVFAGSRPVSGPQRWVLILPYREYGPVRYGVTVQARKLTSIAGANTAELSSTTLEHAVLTN